VLGKAGTVSSEERSRLLKAHHMPQAQVALGRLLATRHLATAMIDVSDGVLQDLGHICDESGVGAEVDADRLPVSEAARHLASAAGLDVRDWGLTGGEDFVLLFCVPAQSDQMVREMCRGELGIELTTIGRITKERGVRVRRDGTLLEMIVGGYDHFRAR
jgi:thiamine-monophosphate kinase